MKCGYHPEREAVGGCVGCGRGICEFCKTIVDDKFYCPTCAEKSILNPEKPQKPIASTQVTADVKKIKEIRYTCKICGHIWHKSAGAESKAAKNVTGVLAGLSCCTAPCCFPLYAGLFGSTLSDKFCPKCHSQDIKRQELNYDSKGNLENEKDID